MIPCLYNAFKQRKKNYSKFLSRHLLIKTRFLLSFDLKETKTKKKSSKPKHLPTNQPTNQNTISFS